MLQFQRHYIAHSQRCILLIQPEIQKLYWGKYFLISKELHNNQETNGYVFTLSNIMKMFIYSAVEA